MKGRIAIISLEEIKIYKVSTFAKIDELTQQSRVVNTTQKTNTYI